MWIILQKTILDHILCYLYWSNRSKHLKEQICCHRMYLCWLSRAQFRRKHAWIHVFQCPIHILGIKAYNQVLFSRVEEYHIIWLNMHQKDTQSWNFSILAPKYWIYELWGSFFSLTVYKHQWNYPDNLKILWHIHPANFKYIFLWFMKNVYVYMFLCSFEKIG